MSALAPSAWPARRTSALVWLVLGGLAVLPYVLVLNQPFISDDYLQISLGRQYGPPSGWNALAGDPLYRARATSLVLTHLTEHFFGFSPLPFYVSVILLHVLNTGLLFALTLRLGLGRRIALCAAAFFAVYEGHQEAVMWYAALHELLVFFFAFITLILWSLWGEGRRPRPLYYAGALAAFFLALLSKESAVALVPLLLVVARDRRRAWRWTMPFAALALAYIAATFAGSPVHQHFQDGTFSLRAPVWMTLPISLGRLTWIWGLLALAALVAWGGRRFRWLVLLGGIWMVVALLPYSFLTYMPRVPSRHTYLASAGLAWIVAAGFVAFWRRFQASSRWPAYALVAVVLLHNCGYIWVKKRAQFLERALPTEALVDLARATDGVIHVTCFPYNQETAELAVEMRLGKPARLVWERSSSDFSPACLETPSQPALAADTASDSSAQGSQGGL